MLPLTGHPFLMARADITITIAILRAGQVAAFGVTRQVRRTRTTWVIRVSQMSATTAKRKMTRFLPTLASGFGGAGW